MTHQMPITGPGESRKRAAFRDAVDAEFMHKNLGENGTPQYTDRGVGSNVLALSQMVRGGDPSTLVNEILANGTTNEVVDMIVMLFVMRNCRGGKGEKKLPFDVFLRVWAKYPDTAKKLLTLFPHFGYWKDLLLLMKQAKSEPWFGSAEELGNSSIELMKDQFVKDVAAFDKYKSDLKEAMDEEKIQELKRNGPGISLLAKWLPREQSSFDKKLDFVRRFVEATNNDKEKWQSSAKAHYRRSVTELTSYLDLPEVLLAAQKEDEIQFGKVAARATMRLRKVFLNEDANGRTRSENPKRARLAERFLGHVVKNGLKGAQLQPHEIVEKIMSKTKISKEEELVLDAQWKDLWRDVVEKVKAKAAEEGLEFSPTQMVPLCDVSGSMTGLPMCVAIALAIGISEITHDAFKNMILTFESNPRWHRLNSTDSIVKKVRSLAKAPWGGSTNFSAAYDRILEVAENARLDKEDMPSLIVFSDMQFDVAGGMGYSYNNSKRTNYMEVMHDKIASKFKTVAARLGWGDSDPTPMVYWNLRNTGGHPVDKDTEGAVMLAGFSPSLLKLVMYGEALREEEVAVVQNDGSVVIKKVRVTPEDILRKMLDDKLYDCVREILIASREGALLEYEIPLNGATGNTEGSGEEEFDVV